MLAASATPAMPQAMRALARSALPSASERCSHALAAPPSARTQAATHSRIGPEPSCVAVFKDELVKMLPHDQDALRLSRQTFHFAEFLDQEGYEPPVLPGKALLHGHCHHKAIMKLDAEAALLRKMGLDLDIPDTGCCGMAGAFGFEKGDKYDVSVACGERVLLPAVRAAAADALIVTDGFSCREQIAQLTERRALHLAQVLQLALHDGPTGPARDYPETRHFEQQVGKPSRRWAVLSKS